MGWVIGLLIVLVLISLCTFIVVREVGGRILDHLGTVDTIKTKDFAKLLELQREILHHTRPTGDYHERKLAEIRRAREDWGQP